MVLYPFYYKDCYSSWDSYIVGWLLLAYGDINRMLADMLAEMDYLCVPQM